MDQQRPRADRFFFGTRSLPCPYLPSRVERKVVTELSGPNANALYTRLSRAGFRRSHGLAYRPACPACNACVPVRIDVEGFVWSRSLRRVLAANSDLTVEPMVPVASIEQYRLFARYQAMRHGDGDMAEMTFGDYRAMIEDTPVETRVVEFRDPENRLVGAMLADEMEDSLSAVYSFFEPRAPKRGLGTLMILWLVERAKETGLPYVYLGYMIDESDKMAYKARFRPLEHLGADGWRPMGG